MSGSGRPVTPFDFDSAVSGSAAEGGISCRFGVGPEWCCFPVMAHLFVSVYSTMHQGELVAAIEL